MTTHLVLDVERFHRSYSAQRRPMTPFGGSYASAACDALVQDVQLRLRLRLLGRDQVCT